jgi:hypothetical protein
VKTEITFRFEEDTNARFFCSQDRHPNVFPDRRIVESILPGHTVNFVLDGELGPLHFVEESDDGVEVNHLALTYRF